MEHIIERMQDDNAGVSVKNVKTFMNKNGNNLGNLDLFYNNKLAQASILYFTA